MERYIQEPSRRIPITGTCDVLVAGGGIAGIAAAAAAARNGKRVILLEREYALGGMSTLGLVTIYLPLCDGAGRQLVFGLGEELLKLSIRDGAEANYPAAWLDGGTREERVRQRYLTQFNPHLFALRAEELLLSLGVTVLYGTLACGAAVEDGFLTAVMVENKSGRSAIEAGAVVDCIGDADLCALAGAKTALYRNGNGLASWYYYAAGGNVSLKMFGLADIAQPPQPDDDCYQAAKTESLDAMRFSGVDGPELSRAVLTAHRKMFEDILEQRAQDPGYVPVCTSSIPLVRMSRRLAGAQTLDETADYIRRPDSIGMTGDWRRRGPAFELPFGILHGTEVKNLLAAGRAVSVTDAMWDVTRVIPPCAVTGQAAGTAAALGRDMTKLDVGALQARLQDQGVRLHLD